MKVVQITTDNRVHFKDYTNTAPYFGTAPSALLQGFATLNNKVEVHVISLTKQRMLIPSKLATNIWFHQPLIPSWGMGRSFYVGAIFAVRKLLQEIKPDIVHGQGTERECAIAAAYSGYPNVITIHGNMRVHARHGINRNKPYYKVAALLENIALRKTNGVISISTYTDKLIKNIVKKKWLIPNATDSSYFDAVPAPANTPSLLFVGGLDERKNPISFINACGDIIAKNGWRLRLCGDCDSTGNYITKLRELASTRPWIEFAGWKKRSDLLTELEQASLLVMPTLEDNCPMAILEAMSAGLPIIASRIGGIPDLITHDKTGMLFDPLNAESMRMVTQTMILDTDKRKEMARAAREEAWLRFHPSVVAEAHMRIYHEILTRKNP